MLEKRQTESSGSAPRLMGDSTQAQGAVLTESFIYSHSHHLQAKCTGCQGNQHSKASGSHPLGLHRPVVRQMCEQIIKGQRNKGMVAVHADSWIDKAASQREL